MAEEGLEKTMNDLIYIGSPIVFDTDVFLDQLSRLMDAAFANRDDIRDLVEEIVPTYRVAKSHRNAGSDDGKAADDQNALLATV